MDPIEPIRLDTNLLNAALQQNWHSQRQDELQRHHDVLEDVSKQKLSMDAAEQVIKDPDASPFQKYQAANTRYHALAPGKGDLPPVDYTNNSADWHNFVLNLNTNGSQSPEVMDSLQRLNQNSPYFRQQAEQAMKQKQAVEMNRGYQTLPTRAGQDPLTHDEAFAAEHSPPGQKEIFSAAVPSAKDTAIMKGVTQKTHYYEVQEGVQTHALQALQQVAVRGIDLGAEQSYRQALSKGAPKGALAGKLSSKDSQDQLALQSGAMTKEEREQAKTAIPEQMKQLSGQARALQIELSQHRNDVSGKARPAETIQAELTAVRTALGLRSKELAYLQQPGNATFNALTQAYAAHQTTLDTYTNNILKLRQSKSSVASEALLEFNKDKYAGLQAGQSALLRAVSKGENPDVAAARLGDEFKTPPHLLKQALEDPTKKGQMNVNFGSPGERTKIAQEQTLVGQMDELIKDFKPGYVGVIDEKIGRAGQMMGTLSKAREQWIARQRAMISDLRSEKFGAALTATEIKRAESELPNEKMGDQQWVESAKAWRDNWARKIDNRIKLIEKGKKSSAVEDRFAELQKSGKSKEEIFQQLMEEGH